MVQHLAPRRTSAGTLDLTASTLFIRDIDKHGKICEYARKLNKLIPYRKTQINLGAALQMMLRALHGLYTLWRQKTPLTPDDLNRPGLDEEPASFETRMADSSWVHPSQGLLPPPCYPIW